MPIVHEAYAEGGTVRAQDIKRNMKFKLNGQTYTATGPAGIVNELGVLGASQQVYVPTDKGEVGFRVDENVEVIRR